MELIQGPSAKVESSEADKAQEEEAEMFGVNQPTVELPRFIRVNNRTNTAFIKLKGKVPNLSATQ